MQQSPLKVGIREFRADLADHIASNTPVAVTRHGDTVGYFIATQGQTEADATALKRANNTLDQLLLQHQVDAEQMVAEFKAARQKNVSSIPRKPKTP